MRFQLIRLFPVGPAILACFAIAFLGLAAVSTWDVMNIIDDYMNDNRFTLVKLTKINNSYPFIGNIHIRLHYKHAIFLELYKSINATVSTAPTNIFFGNKFGLYERGLPWRKNLTPSENFSLTAAYDLFVFKDYLYRMDERGLAWINDTQYKVFPVNSTRINEMVDTYLANPHSIQLVKNVWLNTRNRFVQTVKPTESIVLESVSTFYAGFEIRLGDILTRNNGKVSIPLDLIQLNSIDDAANTEQLPTSVEISYGETYINKFGIRDSVYFDETYSSDSDRKDKTTNITMIMTNGQVIDRKKFPPCNNEFSDELVCLEDLKLRVIGEVCNCTTFSRALKKALNSTNNATDDTASSNLCTAAKYETCWTKANEKALEAQEAARQDQSCTPCVTLKNNYKISRTDTDQLNSAWKPWYPRTVLTVECRQGNYLLYEERKQNSINQLFSMVGGDLGLYIGFSMISVLQMFLFLYHMHNHHNECEHGNGSAIRRWMRHCTCYIFRSFELANYSCRNAKDEARYNDMNEELRKHKTFTAQLIETVNMKVEAIDVEKQVEDILAKRLKAMDVERQIEIKLKKQLEAMDIAGQIESALMRKFESLQQSIGSH